MIDDSKHSREAYRVEQSLAARHYEKEIKLLERKVKVLSDMLIMCEGYISVHDKSGDMVERINEALKEVGKL